MLHDKLSTATRIVQEGLDIISQNSSVVPKVDKLKKAISDLKLDELDVDVASTQLMLQEELAQLRISIDGGSIKGGGGSDTGRVKILEDENKSLRDLLNEAKLELSKGPDAVMPPPPPGGKSAEVKDLEAQLARKDAQIQSQQSEISKLIAASSAADVTRALEDELKRSKAEVAKLEVELTKTKKDAADQLAAKTKELTELADKRVSEVESRLEAEKDEMMDAMAQEVEVMTCFSIVKAMEGTGFVLV